MVAWRVRSARRGLIAGVLAVLVILALGAAAPAEARAHGSLRQLNTITVGPAPMDVATVKSHGGLAYVSNFDSNTVSVIDTRHNQVIDTVTVGTAPSPVVASPDGRFVYVGTQASIAVIDTGTQRVVREIGTDDAAFALEISPNGQFLYGDSGGSGPVTVFDTRSGAAIRTVVPSNGHPGALSVSADGCRLYVGIFDKPYWVDVFDTASFAQLATISVPLNPFGLTLSPNGRQLYVTNWGDYSEIIPKPGHTVQVFDTATLTLLGTVNVGEYPSSVAFTPDGSFAYVVNNANPGRVTTIRTRDRQVLSTVGVGACPTSVAIAPDSHQAYVTNTGVCANFAQEGNTVSVLSTQSAG